jgi:hypothetical protein
MLAFTHCSHSRHSKQVRAHASVFSVLASYCAVCLSVCAPASVNKGGGEQGAAFRLTCCQASTQPGLQCGRR